MTLFGLHLAHQLNGNWSKNLVPTTWYLLQPPCRWVRLNSAGDRYVNGNLTWHHLNFPCLNHRISNANLNDRERCYFKTDGPLFTPMTGPAFWFQPQPSLGLFKSPSSQAIATVSIFWVPQLVFHRCLPLLPSSSSSRATLLPPLMLITHGLSVVGPWMHSSMPK
jgi:hypothetical protein